MAIFIVGVALLGAAEMRVSGKLRKGFKALEIYNYFDAKDYFYKALKKDSVPAAYGLSIIFSRDDNPFFAPDSAWKFIQIATDKFPELDDKTKEDYLEIGVDSAAISEQLYRVDSLFYREAQELDSLPIWDEFIANHYSDPFFENAVKARNSLAFEQARAENSASAYRDFMDTYPESFEFEKAKEAYDAQLFKEQTAGDDIKEYRVFIQNHPDSPFRSRAEKRIFEKYTVKPTPSAYLKFIRENPNNENVEKAWRKIYALEIRELTPTALAAFSIKYPEYPFLDELRSDFSYATTRYYPVEKSGKWGFIDENGKLRIECRFEFVELFSESIALVGMKEKVAYVDKSGKLITGFEYDSGFSFKNGFAVVEKDGLYGVINRQGAQILSPVYEDVGEYSEGLIYADKGDGYGYFDTDGVQVIDFLFDNATDFHKGKAIVELGEHYGLINRRAQAVTEFKYDWIEPFKDPGQPSRTKIGNRFGLMKPNGAAICDSLYFRIGTFSNGLALVYNDKQYGFVNTSCDTVIEFKYTFTEEAFSESKFVNGFAKVWQKDQRREVKVGIIDTSGSKVFPAIFEDTGIMKGKLIPVKKNGKWGYADLNVELVIPYKYKSAANFERNLALVQTDDGYNLIDTLGAIKLDMWYKTFERLDTLAIVSDTLYGLIDTAGTEWVPQIYNSYRIMDEHVIRFNREMGNFDYFDFRRMKFIWREAT